jgi:tetratricopeptide (TPR) repeat protein
VVIGTIVYAPASHGPFLFDDLAQPYGRAAHGVEAPGHVWLSYVRPALLFSYWVNWRLSGGNTESYHVFNLLCHLINTMLVFFLIQQLITLDRNRDPRDQTNRSHILALLGAGLFLLHPLQTESVSYIASRSENLTACFLLSSYLIFLRRAGERMSWGAAAAAVGLFAMAGATKESAVALVPLIVLTDWFFRLGGVRRNWRFYGLLGGVGLATTVLAFVVLKNARSAGFGVVGVTWQEYLFTQLRSVLVYLRLFLLPVGQTIDHDFPISRTFLDHGSWLALVALAAIVVAVLRNRRPWGLISFGILAWIVLLAPTSSVVPIRDPLVEHRMYLPILGLILASVGIVDRLRINTPELILGSIVLLVVLGGVTYGRNTMWADPAMLWQEAVKLSPRKGRPYMNLASEYLRRGRCRDASAVFAGAPPEWRPDYYALVTWGTAQDCLANYDSAISIYRRAYAFINDTWERTPGAAEAKLKMLIGWSLLKKGDGPASLAALNGALELDPTLDMAYVYRGLWMQNTGNIAQAVADYQHAINVNPRNPLAGRALAGALSLR